MIFLYLWLYVQIILESLPISSSGHVALLDSFCRWYNSSQVLSLDFCHIDFLLHGPTIVILLVFFFVRWWHMLIGMPFTCKTFMSNNFWTSVIKTALFLGIADGVTFLFWWLQPFAEISLTIGFFITALLLYSLRNQLYGQKKFNWCYQDALILGVTQGISLVPGISRFASTYTMSVLLGYDRKSSFALSFLIQMPLLIAAFFKGTLAVASDVSIMQLLSFNLLVAMIIATIISYIVLSFVEFLIDRKKLWYLAFYMIVPISFSFLL